MASISLKYKSKSGNLTAPGDVDPGAMIPISTATGTGSSGVITFSSIPQNYEHLQLRLSVSSSKAASPDYIKMQFNSDTSTNYAYHFLRGDGSSAGANGGASQSTAYVEYVSGADSSSVQTASIIDILDYSNTNKFKTEKNMTGYDINGNGNIFFHSNLWRSTDGITTITLTMNGGNFTSSSKVALYGIKRAGA